MAEPTPRTQKLNWYKSLAGADLTPAEFQIIVLLTSYSNASMENAYPGVARLAKDAGMDKRRVQRILQRLVAKNAIAVTQEGGNQVFKGAATVYKILTPPQRPKGETQFTLQSDKSGSKGDIGASLKGGTHDTLHGATHDPERGDKSGSKGDISTTEGGTSGTERAVPVPPHQVIDQVIHHSDSYESASLAPQATARHGEDHDENDDDHYDLVAIEDELDEELGLDDEERRTVDGMLQRGMHPNAVRNKINSDRIQAVHVAMSQAKKRLDEDPRCKTCGVNMSRHAQWLADSGDTHIFATTMT